MQGEGLKKLRSRNILIILLVFILSLSIFTVSNESNAEEKYEVDGVTAELSEDGTLTITGSGELKKELVTKFDYKKDIKKVIVKKGVTCIGNFAFQYCSSLTIVEIPEGVTSIGKYAFSNCSSLTSIIIPEGVTSIGEYAFDRCNSLPSIEIPSSVTSIGRYAFHYCRNLTSIEIPSSVTSIGESAFVFCSSLTSIQVDKNNKNYCSDNGVLCDKSLTEIICYPLGKEETTYTIPNGVISIGNRAFYNCKLTSIEIPEGVTIIGDYAFCGCSILERITVPNSVTEIGDSVFLFCDELTIYCKSKSTAEQYAKDNSITYITDDEPPGLEVTGNVTNWTKDDVILTIKASDELSGLKNVTVNGTEVTITNGTGTYKASENGTYTVIATDNVGKTRTENVVINKIDKTKPTIKSVTGNAENWTYNSVTLTVNAEDKESGIASTNAYSFDNGKTWQTSNSKTYTQNTNGIIIKVKDNVGHIAEYEEINITKIKTQIIEIKEYTEENNIIKGVQPNTTLKNLKNNIIIHNNEYVKILNKDNKELQETDIITTGTKIRVTAYDEVIEYTIIVIGDTTGDGQADIKDILSINKHRLNKAKLENEYFQAGDVNNDGTVDIKDILQINKYRLGKINSL